MMKDATEPTIHTAKMASTARMKSLRSKPVVVQEWMSLATMRMGKATTTSGPSRFTRVRASGARSCRMVVATTQMVATTTSTATMISAMVMFSGVLSK